jgi:hypothetical protein
MRSKASQVHRYAIALGLCQFNVVDEISRILKTGKVQHRSAITDTEMLGQLLRNIDQNFGRGEIVVDYAIKILPHVFVRLNQPLIASLYVIKRQSKYFNRLKWNYLRQKMKRTIRKSSFPKMV